MGYETKEIAHPAEATHSSPSRSRGRHRRSHRLAVLRPSRGTRRSAGRLRSSPGLRARSCTATRSTMPSSFNPPSTPPRFLVWFDNKAVDGFVNGSAAFVGGLSGRMRRYQTGYARSYALSMVGGAVLVLLALVSGEGLVTSFPWLTALGVVPLVGSIVVALLPKGRTLLAKQVALVFALATLVLTVAHGTAVPGRQRTALPVRRVLPMDPGVRHLLLGRSRRDRPRAGGAGRHARADRRAGGLERRRRQPRLGQGLLLADPGPRDPHDRRVLGHRRLPVLRVLRGRCSSRCTS